MTVCNDVAVMLRFVVLNRIVSYYACVFLPNISDPVLLPTSLEQVFLRCLGRCAFLTALWEYILVL